MAVIIPVRLQNRDQTCEYADYLPGLPMSWIFNTFKSASLPFCLGFIVLYHLGHGVVRKLWSQLPVWSWQLSPVLRWLPILGTLSGFCIFGSVVLFKVPEFTLTLSYISVLYTDVDELMLGIQLMIHSLPSYLFRSYLSLHLLTLSEWWQWKVLLSKDLHPGIFNTSSLEWTV